MLISKTDLDSKKSREPIPLECLHCGKTHYRTKNTILRIIQGDLIGTGKGNFCSQKCKHEQQKTTKNIPCKECGKLTEKTKSEICSGNVFCNHSCSATFNNKLRIKKDKLNRICLFCQSSLTKRQRFSNRNFCSMECCKSYNKRQLDKKISIQLSTGQVIGHSRHTIRRFLIEQRGQKCEICGITKWLNKPLVVILDHIDGNSDNNLWTNLRLICSNCDSTLPTYKSKNKGNGREYRRKKKLEPLVGVAPT